MKKLVPFMSNGQKLDLKLDNDIQSMFSRTANALVAGRAVTSTNGLTVQVVIRQLPRPTYQTTQQLATNGQVAGSQSHELYQATQQLAANGQVVGSQSQWTVSGHLATGNKQPSRRLTKSVDCIRPLNNWRQRAKS